MSNPAKTVEREIRQIIGVLPRSFITRNIREQMDISISINSMNGVIKRLITSGEVKRVGRTIRHGESFTLYQKTAKFSDEIDGFQHLRNSRMAIKNLEAAMSNWRATSHRNRRNNPERITMSELTEQVMHQTIARLEAENAAAIEQLKGYEQLFLNASDALKENAELRARLRVLDEQEPVCYAILPGIEDGEYPDPDIDIQMSKFEQLQVLYVKDCDTVRLPLYAGLPSIAAAIRANK